MTLNETFSSVCESLSIELIESSLSPLCFARCFFEDYRISLAVSFEKFPPHSSFSCRLRKSKEDGYSSATVRRTFFFPRQTLHVAFSK